MRDRLYSTAELARICGVSISTIKRWTDSGRLRCVRTPGGHRKFRLQDVAQAARQLGTTLAAAPAETEPPRAEVDELALLLLQDNPDALVARAADALELGEPVALRTLLIELHRHGMRLTEVAGRVLLPGLDEVLRGRRTNADDDFVQRRAQRLAEDALRYLEEQIPPAEAPVQAALIASSGSPSDRLWSELTVLGLREEGWKVLDLGDDVPAETLRSGITREHPALVVLLAPRGAAPTALPEGLAAAATAHGAEVLILERGSDPAASLAQLEERALRREQHAAASSL